MNVRIQQIDRTKIPSNSPLQTKSIRKKKGLHFLLDIFLNNIIYTMQLRFMCMCLFKFNYSLSVEMVLVTHKYCFFFFFNGKESEWE